MTGAPGAGGDGGAAAGDARRLFEAAVAGAGAARLLAAVRWDDVAPRPLAAYRRVTVVGAGKAALAMAAAAEPALAERRGRGADAWHGAVTVPHGYPARLPAGVRAPERVQVREAAHPVPDPAGAAAAEEALALAAACGAADLLLVLLSGGASALWAAGAGRVSVDDARRTAGLLLASGAPIAEVNAVRKHLTRVGGGRLALAAAPADVVALVVSDVVGDDPAVIGSGPCTPDPTTYADAAGVLRRYGLWDRAPAAVRAHLDAGLAGRVPETPKPGDPTLAGVRTRVVGGVGDALRAARAAAEAAGYDARMVDAALTGEARDAGARVARAALDAAAAAARDGQPRCLLWGGETTVTVRGPGRGGRNQELALAAAIALAEAADAAPGADVAVLSGGTDGVDGPTDAAGACATARAARAAAARGLDARLALAANDSHTFFAAAGGLLRPGPTHTNVMDVQIAVARPERRGPGGPGA